MARAKLAALGTLTRKAYTPPKGEKPIWLPNFTLTLLRTPFLPNNCASFIAPLHMNKLDIKDYLWHAYGIPVLSVRSFVAQRPVQKLQQGQGRAVQRRWHRPRSIKKMTVEMGTREEGMGGKGGGLFIWPKAPEEDEDFEPWDKKTFDAMEDAQERFQKEMGDSSSARLERPGRQTIAQQARRLLEGKEEWRPTWKDLQGE